VAIQGLRLPGGSRQGLNLWPIKLFKSTIALFWQGWSCFWWSATVVNKMKFLRRWIDQESALKVVTSQYFGLAYYASPVWMTPDIPCQSGRKLYNLHYRALRAAVKDPKQQISRPILDTISQRAMLAQWARYSVASTAICLINGSTTRLANEQRQKMCINDRMPKNADFLMQPDQKLENNVLVIDWRLF